MSHRLSPKQLRLATALAAGRNVKVAADLAGFSRSHASRLLHHDQRFKDALAEIMAPTLELTADLVELTEQTGQLAAIEPEVLPARPLSTGELVRSLGERIARNLTEGVLVSSKYLRKVLEDKDQSDKNKLKAAQIILSTRPRVAVQVDLPDPSRERLRGMPLADLARETLETLQGQFGEM